MIPKTRKFYNSILLHLERINSGGLFFKNLNKFLSISYNKESKIVYSYDTQKSINLSPTDKFINNTVDLIITEEEIKILEKIIQGNGERVIKYNEEKNKLDIFEIFLTVKEFDMYDKKTDTYYFYGRKEQIEILLEVKVNDTYIDLSNYYEVICKNMGDKDKQNNLLINNSNDIKVNIPKENNQIILLNINDYSEENIIRVKVNESKDENFWLYKHICIINQQ